MTHAPARPDVGSPVDGPDLRVEPRPALLVHGHFYQPAREDPFTGLVPRDPSASPAHDWNDFETGQRHKLPSISIQNT